MFTAYYSYGMLLSKSCSWFASWKKREIWHCN